MGAFWSKRTSRTCPLPPILHPLIAAYLPVPEVFAWAEIHSISIFYTPFWTAVMRHRGYTHSLIFLDSWSFETICVTQGEVWPSWATHTSLETCATRALRLGDVEMALDFLRRHPVEKTPTFSAALRLCREAISAGCLPVLDRCLAALLCLSPNDDDHDGWFLDQPGQYRWWPPSDLKQHARQLVLDWALVHGTQREVTHILQRLDGLVSCDAYTSAVLQVYHREEWVPATMPRTSLWEEHKGVSPLTMLAEMVYALKRSTSEPMFLFLRDKAQTFCRASITVYETSLAEEVLASAARRHLYHSLIQFFTRQAQEMTIIQFTPPSNSH